jgi:hypothetical protein
MQLLIVQYEAIFEDASAIPAQGQVRSSLSCRDQDYYRHIFRVL